MAENSQTSSSDEWQFVTTTSRNSEEFSDDESIEIIEREVLQNVIPSSYHETVDDELNELENSNWEAPGYSVEPTPGTIQTETTQPLNFVFDEHQSLNHSMFNLSLKVFYSCMLAAILSIILHQCQDYLINNPSNGTRNEITKGFFASISNRSPHLPASSKDQITSQDDSVITLPQLMEKQLKFNQLIEKYKLIESHTSVLDKNIYYINMSGLSRSMLHNYCDKYHASDDLCDILFHKDDIDELCLWETESKGLPKACRDVNGEVILFLKKEQYEGMMRSLLDSVSIDEKRNSKLGDLFMKRSEIDRNENPSTFPDNVVADKEPSNWKLNRESSDFSRTIKYIENLGKIRSSENVNSGDGVKLTTAEDEMIDKRGLMVTFNRLIAGLIVLTSKLSIKFDLDRLQLTCNENSKKNEAVSCILADEISRKTKVDLSKSDTLISDKPETDFSKYDPAFVDKRDFDMDRIRREFPDHDWEEVYKNNWRRFRKRNKVYEKKEENIDHEAEDDVYKRYISFMKNAKKKIKTDFKKFTSHVESKIKKFTDSMKRNYEKLMPSKWKHYARSVFVALRL